MRVAAIIAAGGRGSRLGDERPKQFLEIAGKSLLERSIEPFARSARVDEIVIALPLPDAAQPPAFLRRLEKPTTIVEGGADRQRSVANAFGRISSGTDVVVIHDAARPFVSADLIARTVDAAALHGAAIAAIPVHDTVKEILRGSGGVIARTLPRESIFLAQTPQAFRHDVLARALAQSSSRGATDEAMLVEELGIPVRVVEGDPHNIKVTTADDLTKANARAASAMRVGTGYDLHRLVSGRPLVLAGVRIPFELGLQGHSDADAVCHAVTDAILGAAGVGDIGRLFPDNDPQWENADSLQLLRRAMTVIRGSSYAVLNVDLTVIAERPKLLPYLDTMRANLADALGIDPAAVSIKGKTNEAIGEIGRGEAMACHAVALLLKT
ncbi:MAG TPA: 2-C-methyl-D-erythritol 4-phosphate cytidylyltransferase [Vicinamibacterales bacterium]|nr:2-C-methyl-D-erythritol 4-phosphate cytidylyltransferase [Vicinamibacterales bacterium]